MCINSLLTISEQKTFISVGADARETAEERRRELLRLLAEVVLEILLRPLRPLGLRKDPNPLVVRLKLRSDEELLRSEEELFFPRFLDELLSDEELFFPKFLDELFFWGALVDN